MRARHAVTRGAVLVQVVIALVVLFGFTALTTDYGMMAVRQRKLQSATDAAALAAGPEMYRPRNAEAERKAREIADANGITVDVGWAANNPYRIRVEAVDNVASPFMKVLDNRGTRRVSAFSEVEAWTPMTIDVTSKLRPWGIPYTYFNPYDGGFVKFDQRVDLILVENVNEHPTETQTSQYFIQPFALDERRLDHASHFPNYRHDVMFGYNKPVSVSDIFDQDTWMLSLPGNWQDIIDATYRSVMQDPNAIVNRADHIKEYRDDTWDDYDPDNPRLVFIPIFDRTNRSEVGGIPRVQILGFAAFFLEGMTPDGVITGRFVRYALPYDGKTLDPVSVDQLNTGIIQFRLVK